MIRGILRTTTILLAVWMICPWAARGQTAVKIGFVSVQNVMVSTKEGQKASQDLTAKFEPKQKEFDTRQKEITQLEDQLQKGGNVLSEDQRNKTTREIDDKKRRLQRDTQDTQDDLERERQRIIQTIGQRVVGLIDKYGKDNGYTLILDVSNPNTPVMYALSTFDITKEIVALYDKTYASASSPPPSGNPSPK